MPCRHRGEWRYSSHILNLRIRRGRQPALCPSHFIPREIASGTHWVPDLE